MTFGHPMLAHWTLDPEVTCLNRLWGRISAQVYNEKSDYERLADAVAGLWHSDSLSS